jgi:hypothetical protein
MKLKRVSGVTFHIGVRVIGEVKTGLESEVHKVDMYLEDCGVLVIAKGTRPNGDLFPSVLVPFSNIVFLTLTPEEPLIRKAA